LEAVVRAVATGKLGHNEGKAVVRGIREWLRAHEAGAVTDRLDALLDALAEWRETGDPAPVLELVE
jgi:site-specific recombinase